MWNRENRFTGWCDVPLTEEGEQEAVEAGELLAQHGFRFDVAFTSELSRASRTCERVMQHTRRTPDSPIVRRAELNERHYGALQGMRKDDPWLTAYYSESEVFEWRKSYYLRPPPMDSSHEHWRPPPTPLTESLADCQARVDQYYHEHIEPVVRSGANVLIAAHANTLRALIKTVDDISNANIRGLRVPNSIPLVYRLDKHNLEPVAESDDWGFQGEYLVNTITHNRIHAYERSQRRVLMALFRALDENGDGGISLDEMENGLRHLAGAGKETGRTRTLLTKMRAKVQEPVGLDDFMELAGSLWTDEDHFRMLDAKAKKPNTEWEMPLVGGATAAEDGAVAARLHGRAPGHLHQRSRVLAEEDVIVSMHEFSPHHDRSRDSGTRKTTPEDERGGFAVTG